MDEGRAARDARRGAAHRGSTQALEHAGACRARGVDSVATRADAAEGRVYGGCVI